MHAAFCHTAPIIMLNKCHAEPKCHAELVEAWESDEIIFPLHHRFGGGGEGLGFGVVFDVELREFFRAVVGDV